jgi:diguanylate cyclase
MLQRLQSLRQRDALLALGTMLIAGLLLTLAQYVALTRNLHSELTTQARILAQTAQAAVVFRDINESTELLRPLAAHPAILRARLTDPQGQPLALYEQPGAAGHWADTAWHVPSVSVPIVANGRTIGEVELTACIEPLWEQLAAFVAATAVIMGSALALVAWVSRRMRANVRVAEERQRYLAVHDALTGLANRDAFNEALQRATRRATVASPGFALIFIDLDNFKRVNDTFGHTGGDALLQTVAQRLRMHVRSSDVVGRLGGDEFAVLLRTAAGQAGVTAIIAAILRDLAEPFEYQGDRIAASASAGVALYPADGSTDEALLQAADAAMYHAKRLGKNAFEFYSARIASGLAAQRALEVDLRQAMATDGLWLAYQPVFDAASRIVSFEALVRWTHPSRGAVSPGEFVPLAESCGLMPELGLAILRRAASDIRHWRRQGLAVPRVAINLSSRQFTRERHQAEFVECLERFQLTPAEVSFELTESAVFEDLSSPVSIIAALQARGYALALDDFGTGYSSLAYLLRLRCNTLKIDRVFVHGASASKESSLLVGAMVHVAHALGMQVIAEGVEDPADLAHMRALGCDAVQGFVLSKPLPAQAAMALLDAVPMREQLLSA